MTAAPAFHHLPVLGPRSVDLLDPRDGGLYVDGTVGGGGHTRLILERCDDCRVLAVDRDPEALEAAARNLEAFAPRVRFLSMRFDGVTDDPEVRDRGIEGALLDLGVSSHQIDVDARGFTFREGAPLDMRMTPEGETAADFLNDRSLDELQDVFRRYGEERRARALAREVVRRREERPFATSDDLVAAVMRVLGPRTEHQDKARIFQAVRIAINGELEALEQALPALRDALTAGGVLVVIAYHSLEDRIVKHAFREWSRECICPPELPVCACRGVALGTVLTRKPERPSADEVESNPRARSALLRAWRKAA
ncbi:16S rRNA (cytosine(1402)-N(4))-methyltransferase RsmH [Gaopeijia maritima]|uniref:16S rRNA (cytosine(1402)-N(4))-methyltransferase RsmH n=1 Tax=Gaopeijia maritima TaxID=3119007 RepID=UPI003256263F